MKLVDVWNARSAFNTLSQLKKPPKIAYRLMRYGKLFAAEFDACEAQRVAYVYEVAGVEPGTPNVNLIQGTPEFDVFVAKFNEFLSNEAELAPLDMSMDTLIDALDSERGNVLSEAELALLAPFFQEKKPTDLRVVS